jgi:hypothetical protein
MRKTFLIEDEKVTKQIKEKCKGKTEEKCRLKRKRVECCFCTSKNDL